MAVRNLSQLKGWFKRGMYPTESQFGDWLDSFFHRDDKIPVGSVDGLAEAINGKAEKSSVDTLSQSVTTVSQQAIAADQKAQQAIEEAGNIISTLRDGVAPAGDTLAKLYALIQTINEVLHSDDVTLDTVQEIVAFIKNNKDVIDTISTSKVSITDIVDNLLSTAANKPLSANQGKVLKQIIDDLASSQASAAKVIQLSVCFSDAQEATISFPVAATIKKISWDASLFTSVQAGVGTASTITNGNTISIAVAAGSALNLKVAFATGKTIGSLLIEGSYN